MQQEIATTEELSDEINTILIDLAPEEIDSGAEVTIRARVRCSPVRDLSGEVIEIRSADGSLSDSLTFTAFDGETSETGELTFFAPGIAGEYDYTAFLAASEIPDAEHEEMETAFTLAVKPHRTSLLVWGAPTAIGFGETFSVQVGLKCRRECDMTGREVGIFDHNGRQVATAVISGDIRPGTSALHYTEVTLTAPEDEGRHNWEARLSPSDEGGTSHGEAAATFALRFVPAPDCEVKVEVVDADTDAPIRNATVVLHPFRGNTDDLGVARIRVRSGSYTIMVSAAKYEAVKKEAEVTGDYTTQARLTLEPEEDPDAHYY